MNAGHTANFMVNPTSCAEKHVFATVTSTAGAVAHDSDRFQVTDCERLGLAPKLTITVGARHHTRAGASTPLMTAHADRDVNAGHTGN